MQMTYLNQIIKGKLFIFIYKRPINLCKNQINKDIIHRCNISDYPKEIKYSKNDIIIFKLIDEKKI